MADQIFGVNCGFFDAINYDRTYSADDMNKPYSRVLADGVFATNTGDPSSDLQVVSAGSGMQITVQQGQGIFASKWFENQSSILITIPANNAVNPRFDSVLVQVDKRTSGRVGNIVYRTGTASADPQPPDIGTVANVIEYRLANIYVAPGANTINNDAITDLRGSAACPWVTGLIQQVDTSTLWQQFYAAYQNQFNEFTADYTEYTEEQRQAWEDFLSTLTSELSVSTNILMFTSNYTAAGSVTNIPINIASYDHDTDVLLVFINGLLAMPDKYSISSPYTNITLTNAIAAGNTVSFLCLHSVIAADIESTVSMITTLNNRISSLFNDSGWINFTLESGATAYNSDNTPGVRKIGNVSNGFATVYLRGAFKGLTTLGSVICTLPVGYRPQQAHTFTTAAVSGTTVQDTVTIQVLPTGSIKLLASSGSLSSSAMISLATSFLAYD